MCESYWAQEHVTLLQRGQAISGFPLERVHCYTHVQHRSQWDLNPDSGRGGLQSTPPDQPRETSPAVRLVGAVLVIPQAACFHRIVLPRLSTAHVHQGKQPDTHRFIAPLRANMEH